MASRVSSADRAAFRTISFAGINKKSMVTFCLLGVIALGTLEYVGALYGIFSFGLQLRDQNREIAQLRKDTDRLEVSVQRSAANFPVEHKEQLNSMERISEVRYLTGENVAVSYMPARP